MAMLPEEKARVKIDKQLRNAGWDIVSRNEYLPNSTTAVKEALMAGNTESDYLLFIDGKAIAIVEAKREENPLGDDVKKQAEDYAVSPQPWYALWFEKLIPLVYMANGNKIYFRNMLVEDSEYEELTQMHSPKKMLQIVGKKSEYGALPLLEKRGLRDCQYKAETKFEESLKLGNKKNLAVLATGSGKTYLACLASYRLLNYTPTKRILFLVDRNNLARQTESEFCLFDRTENQQKMGSLYTINRLRKEADIKSDIVISPPFGTRPQGSVEVAANRPEFVKTSDNQVNFLQHIMSIVKTGGRVGVVLPDSVLTDTGATEKVREKLLKDFNLHTILRLPTGIFYANGVKTNVLFFEKGKSTKDIWVYDYRTGIKHTMATKPMTRAHLQDFVDCYCTGHEGDRVATYSEDNPNGRWRCFSEEEVKNADNLDFKWLDLEEKDERTIAEVLEDMQAEADGIAEAVAQLKQLLGGIEI